MTKPSTSVRLHIPKLSLSNKEDEKQVNAILKTISERFNAAFQDMEDSAVEAGNTTTTQTIISGDIESGAGTGNMTKAVYDTNNDGTVDMAAGLRGVDGLGLSVDEISDGQVLGRVGDKLSGVDADSRYKGVLTTDPVSPVEGWFWFLYTAAVIDGVAGSYMGFGAFTYSGAGTPAKWELSVYTSLGIKRVEVA